jgi:hypothetical protein
MRSLLLTLLIFTALSLSVGYDNQKPSEGFHFIKEWELGKGRSETSYVLTKGTEYNFVFLNADSGEFYIEDQQRSILLRVTVGKTASVILRSTSTGIRYLRYHGDAPIKVTLGFRR